MSSQKELTNLLSSLDLDNLSLDERCLKVAMQAESTLDALGKIRQQLQEHKMHHKLSTLDKILQKKFKAPQGKSLFPNAIPPDSFGISSLFSDSHQKVIEMSKDDLQSCYLGNKTISVSFKNTKQVAFRHRKMENFYGSIEDFMKIAEMWKNPRLV